MPVLPDAPAATTHPGRRRFLARLAAASALPLVAACADAPSRRLQPVTRAPRTALLLPLGGPTGDLGRRMAKAVWLVEESSGSRQRVATFDTGTTAEGAAQAARQAAAAGAEIIVGPLFSDQTPAVVAAAPQTEVISLSNNDALAGTGAWVFGVTPAHSATAALRFASSEGARTVTLLQPEGAFGQRSAEALAAGAKSNRIKALAPVPGSVSGANLIAALQSVGGGTMPGCLYVPAADEASLRHAARAVEAGIQTIGSLQWAGLDRSRLAGMDKLCFAGPDPVRFARLSDAYRDQLDEEMGVLAGLAIDAVAFAGTLQRNGRGQFAIARAAPVDGLLGKCSFRADFTCERDLAVLRIEGGEVRRIA